MYMMYCVIGGLFFGSLSVGIKINVKIDISNMYLLIYD